MSRRTIPALVVALVTAGGFLACSNSTPTTPDADRSGPDAALHRVAGYGAEVPLAYYQLSLAFSKQTAGFTPPVQSRAYAYMGLALYETRATRASSCRTASTCAGTCVRR